MKTHLFPGFSIFVAFHFHSCIVYITSHLWWLLMKIYYCIFYLYRYDILFCNVSALSFISMAHKMRI